MGACRESGHLKQNKRSRDGSGVYPVLEATCARIWGGVAADISTEGRGVLITQVGDNRGWALLAQVYKKQIEKMVCFYFDDIKLHAKHD